MPRIVVRCVPHPAGEMIRFSFTFACEPPANQSAANVGAQEAATNNITLVFRQTLPHLRSNGSPIQNSLHHTNAMHCSGSLFWLMYRIRIGRSLRCRSFSCIVVPPFFERLHRKLRQNTQPEKPSLPIKVMHGAGCIILAEWKGIKRMKH